MAIPTIFTYPVQRPNFLTGVTWQGNQGDAALVLNLEYTASDGSAASKSLYTTPSSIASLCLPTSKVIADLDEDLLIAHVRMAGMISGTIPGSKEFSDAVSTSGVADARYFQTPIGDVKITNIISLNDSNVRVTMQKGSAATRDINMEIADLSHYSFAPSTQLIVVAGAIRKQYPTYVHDAATNKYLTQAQMDNIAAYVLTLNLWI